MSDDYRPRPRIADDVENINRRLFEIRRAEGREQPPTFPTCTNCGTPFACRAGGICNMQRADEPATAKRTHAFEFEAVDYVALGGG